MGPGACSTRSGSGWWWCWSRRSPSPGSSPSAGGANRAGLFWAAGLGGLVSSTAVTMAMAQRSRERPRRGGRSPRRRFWPRSVMCGRLLVLVAAAGPSLLPRLAPPVGAMAVAGLLIALLLRRGASPPGAAAPDASSTTRSACARRSSSAAVFAGALLLVRGSQDPVRQHRDPDRGAALGLRRRRRRFHRAGARGPGRQRGHGGRSRNRDRLREQQRVQDRGGGGLGLGVVPQERCPRSDRDVGCRRRHRAADGVGRLTRCLGRP